MRCSRAFPQAGADKRYRAQLMDSAASVEANVTEGWARFAPGEIRQFLRYALGSLAEARGHVVDGTDRGYFSMEDCRPALAAADECRAVILGWWRSLERGKE